jgi:hypothetical protein
MAQARSENRTIEFTDVVILLISVGMLVTAASI